MEIVAGEGGTSDGGGLLQAVEHKRGVTPPVPPLEPPWGVEARDMGDGSPVVASAFGDSRLPCKPGESSEVGYNGGGAARPMVCPPCLALGGMLATWALRSSPVSCDMICLKRSTTCNTSTSYVDQITSNMRRTCTSCGPADPRALPPSDTSSTRVANSPIQCLCTLRLTRITSSNR